MDHGFGSHAKYEHHDLGSLQDDQMAVLQEGDIRDRGWFGDAAHSSTASGSNIDFPSYPSIHISDTSELLSSTLSEQGLGSWGSHSGASHYQTPEVASIALASVSQNFDASGSIPIELSHLSVSASLSGSEGMHRGHGDDRLFPRASSSHDNSSDDTAYQPRK